MTTLKIVFLFINLLFIYKYGFRQNFISVYLVLIIYTLISSFFLFKDIFKIKFIQNLNIKLCFKTFVFLVVTIIFLVTFYTDGNSLKVDRWSAMDVAIRALLNGEYPYTAIDHLNGRTSNFPGLLVLGIPFYLLGNVGYLQIFAFLLLSYTLFKFTTVQHAIKYLLLLIVSPAFWWEIFAISDLMSNMIICFCFVLIWQSKFKDDLFSKPYLLGFSTAFLVLTRGIVAIPLTLLFFKPFCKADNKAKLKTIIVFLATFVGLIAIVTINCPSIEILKNYNPLVLQTSYLPSYIHVLAVILPFYCSFKIQNFNTSLFRFSIVLILFPTIVAFYMVCITHGFNASIIQNKYDISYLSIVLPFLIFEIAKPKDNLELS